MIVEIHVLPHPVGTQQATYAHVDAAIEVIAASGLSHEVGALGTTIEGDPERLWPLLQEVHAATLLAGADRTMTTIRIFESVGSEPTMADLVEPHRP